MPAKAKSKSAPPVSAFFELESLECEVFEHMGMKSHPNSESHCYGLHRDPQLRHSQGVGQAFTEPDRWEGQSAVVP